MQELLNNAIRASQHRASSSGIWSHSRGNAYFIFCVGQDEERITSFMSWANVNRINYKPLNGMYRGARERSFIANMKDYPRIQSWLGNEESVLVIDRYDARDIPRASLRYRDGSYDDIGRFVPVSQHTAMMRRSWTHDPTTNQYYITE